MQFWAPGDGRKNCLKHVERLTEINKLWNVASCWLYSANILQQYTHIRLVVSTVICVIIRISECSLPYSQQPVIGSPSWASLIQSASSCPTSLSSLHFLLRSGFPRGSSIEIQPPKVCTHFSSPQVCRLLNSRYFQFDTTILNIMTRQFSPPPISPLLPSKVIPRLTKIIRSGITFVSRNLR